MSYGEVTRWRRYAEKHGGLPLPRLVYLLAQHCTMTNNAHGGKAELRDFMPAAPARKEETLDDLLDQIMGMAAETYGA